MMIILLQVEIEYSAEEFDFEDVYFENKGWS